MTLEPHLLLHMSKLNVIIPIEFQHKQDLCVFSSIKDKPIVSTTNSDVIRGLDEHQVEIGCSVDSLPPAGWSWFKDDSQLDNSPPFQIITEPDNAKSILKVFQKAELTKLSFVWKIINDFVRLKKRQDIMVNTLAKRPIIMVLTNIHSKSLKLVKIRCNYLKKIIFAEFNRFFFVQKYRHDLQSRLIARNQPKLL